MEETIWDEFPSLSESSPAPSPRPPEKTLAVVLAAVSVPGGCRGEHPPTRDLCQVDSCLLEICTKKKCVCLKTRPQKLVRVWGSGQRRQGAFLVVKH